MVITRDSLLENYANLSFLLLFPIFFFYQTLIGLGVIAPILGGYFGIVAITLLPILSILFFLVYNKYCFFDIVFFLLMLHILLISLLNYLFGIPELFTKEMLLWSMSGSGFTVMSYFLAKTISLNSKKFETVLLLAIFGMAIIVFCHIGSAGIFYLRNDSPYAESVVSYQGFARSIVVVSLLLLSSVKNKIMVFFIFIIAFFTLFFNGARTEFVLFVLTCLLAFSYFNVFKIKTILLSLLVFVLPLSLFAVFSDTFFNILPNNRMLELSNLSASTSYQARHWMLMNGLSVIEASPLLGDYGSYTAIGGIGSYPHNLISAWANLGILGFSLYLITFFAIVFILIVNLNGKYTDSSEFKAMLLFSVFTILALTVSKNYSYMLVGFMFGFSSRFYHWKKNQLTAYFVAS